MMDQYFAELYDTPGHTEEKEKVAQAEVFVKLAVDQGIDVNKLTDGQIAELWNATFTDEKTASVPVEQLYNQAEQEFSQVASGVSMQKQADAFGRQAAHAFYSELDEIQKSASRSGGRQISDAKAKLLGLAKTERDAAARSAAAYEGPAAAGTRVGGSSVETIKPLKLQAQEALNSAKLRAKGVGTQLGKGWEAAKGLANTRGGKAGLIGAGLLAAGGLGAGAVHALDKKESSASAIDSLASELAFNKAAEAGWNQEEAAQRITAVLTLGAGGSEKVAAAENVDQALEIRSLELLELAGYPITWE